MKTCQCGHQMEDHIYHEGACRPGGVACSCERFQGRLPSIRGGSHEILKRYLEERPKILEDQIEIFRELVKDLQRMNEDRAREIEELKKDLG